MASYHGMELVLKGEQWKGDRKKLWWQIIYTLCQRSNNYDFPSGDIYISWLRDSKEIKSIYVVLAQLLEKAMAPHSSTLAWKIPWAEEPGRLQSMGSRRVGHDWVTSLSLFTFMHWRRKWQPPPVFLPGESQGWGSLVGCHLCSCTGSDTTDMT